LGIRGAAPQASTGALTFEQFKQMGSAKELSAEDQGVLADMRKRVDSKLKSAEGQKDTAGYDALMMAGLAMMGGNSLADGIAKAAQVGGPTYLAGKKEAAKAIDTAQDAQLAFDKYRMDLRRGDEKAAQSSFKNYMDYTTDLKKIDATLTAASISAQSRQGITPLKLAQLVNNDKEVATAAASLKAAQDRGYQPDIDIAQTRFNMTRDAAESRYQKLMGGGDVSKDPTSTDAPAIGAIMDGYKFKGGGDVSKDPTSTDAPAIGAIMDGYKFKGGNPSDKANWEKA